MLIVESVSLFHVPSEKPRDRPVSPDQQNRYPSRIKGIEDADWPTIPLYPKFVHVSVV